MSSAIRVTVTGRVQGVGFRPFIFGIAAKYQVSGTVQNNMDGVKIHAESATRQNLTSFADEIKANPPRLAKIEHIDVSDTTFAGYQRFDIIPSSSAGASSLVIPIDASVCDECLAEMADRDNFRYGYPFINCTQCGPRYSIISELPYDRSMTTMKDFPMCDACATEYNDPHNRRHHAQPIACPNCGPSLQLHAINGEEIKTSSAMATVRQLLMDGKIVAMKGIGGYHLCVDATNEAAVAALRLRKGRPSRPLAIMAANLETVKKIATVSRYEAAQLQSREAPIVLLQQNYQSEVAPNVAPGTGKIGVMLPYTPVHHGVIDTEILPFIVVTSANPSGLPILYQDELAFSYLQNIADFVLSHNRAILHPIDDSVIACINDQLHPIRRSRGFCPDPITVSTDVHGIVAFGGQMKNTFTIGRRQQAIIGPHIGEMNHIEMEDHFKTELNHLMKWTGVPKRIAVVDLHPNYTTRDIAASYQFDQVVEVQHHHAHMAACIEENQIMEDCYGVILDGTGYGTDGHIWGFEILHGNRSAFRRLGHLTYTPLPGGDKAVTEPWRNAAAMLMQLFPESGQMRANLLFPERTSQLPIIGEMVKKQINSPMAGSCGRLYDAVSAILGICHLSTYDGEAAIRLSELAIPIMESYPFTWELVETVKKDCHTSLDFAKLSMREMFEAIFEDQQKEVPIELIAGKFERTVVCSIIARMKQLPLGKVVLSGGSFHNLFLLEQVRIELELCGFEVFHHHQVPTGDGGLSFGQLIIAANQTFGGK